MNDNIETLAPLTEDVTKKVKAFYEENPFPGYEGVDSAARLREKAEKGIFARLLDEQIPQGARILEVGCGTGQLSNFLGLKKGRSVFGTDVCMNSLKLGQAFKRRNEIPNVAFLQMNLFRPTFRPESFHLVICNGVLHHTNNPFLGLQFLLGLVKKNGFIVLGLYNTFGRIATGIRRLVFRATGNHFQFLDPRLRDLGIEDSKRRIWFMDQYENPHESTHTFAEILNWFDRCGVKFVNSIPKPKAFESFSPTEKIFRPNERATPLDRCLVQLGMIFKGHGEGGFFTFIGQKN